jgi:hypothetical protein
MNLMKLSDSFVEKAKCKTKVIVCIGLQYPSGEARNIPQ